MAEGTFPKNMSTNSRKSHETSAKKEQQPSVPRKTILTGEDSKMFAKTINVPSRKRKTDEEIHKEEHKRREGGAVKKPVDTMKKQHKSNTSTQKIPTKMNEVTVKIERFKEDDLSSNIIDITGDPGHYPPENIKNNEYIKVLESNCSTLSTVLEEKIKIIAEFKDKLSKKDAEVEQLKKEHTSLKDRLEVKHEQILEKTSKQQESSEKIIDVYKQLEKALKKNSEFSRSLEKYQSENKKLIELNKKLERSMDISRSECERHKKNDESGKKHIQDLKDQNGKLLVKNSDLAKQLHELKSMPSPKVPKKEEPVKCNGICSIDVEHIVLQLKKIIDKVSSMEKKMDTNNSVNTKFAKKNWGCVTHQMNDFKKLLSHVVTQQGSNYLGTFERNQPSSYSGPRSFNYN